jgi:hypothetical protein
LGRYNANVNSNSDEEVGGEENGKERTRKPNVSEVCPWNSCKNVRYKGEKDYLYLVGT